MVKKLFMNSEETYEDFCNNASDLIQSVTPSAHFSWINKAWLKTLGYEKEEVADLTIFDILHPDELVHCQELFMKVMSGEDVGLITTSFLTKDGRQIFVEGAVNCRFVDGKPTYTRAIFRDITERKRAEEVLKESEEKFSGAFHSNPHPMSIVTMAEGRYLDVNDSYEQTFGFSREELLGRTTVEMGILKNDRARRKILQSLKERQTVKNLELEFYTRSGRKIETLLSGDKVEIGGQDCLLSVITDITEHKRMQKEVRTLSGLLPICAWCKKLRDDEGYWKSVEQYIGERTKAEFTHGICPECNKKFLQDEDRKLNNNTRVSQS